MHDIKITNSAGLSTRCWVWVLEGQSISLQTRRLSLHPPAVRSVLSEVLDQLNAAEAQGSYRFKPAVHFSALPGSRPTCTVPDDDKRAVWFHFEEQNVSCVTWSSLQFVEVVVFCLLLYLYTRRKVKHIVVVMLLVALLGKDVENLPRSYVFSIQSSFCCLATKNGHLLSSFQSGGSKWDQYRSKVPHCSEADKWMRECDCGLLLQPRWRSSRSKPCQGWSRRP